jgi:hypothetical protein
MRMRGPLEIMSKEGSRRVFTRPDLGRLQRASSRGRYQCPRDVCVQVRCGGMCTPTRGESRSWIRDARGGGTKHM